MGNRLCCGQPRDLGYVVPPRPDERRGTAPSARAGARSARTSAEVRAEWAAAPGDKEARLRQANEKFNREKIRAFEDEPDPVPRNHRVAALLEELRVDIRTISELDAEERRERLSKQQKSLGRHLGRASDLLDAIEGPDAPLHDPELAAAKLGRDFSFVGRRFLAKVVSLYDGDTVRVVFRFNHELVQYRVRMAGYDSPEMKPPKNSPNRVAEIAAAKAARDALRDRIARSDPDSLVFIEVVETKKLDPYGRPLVTMYTRAGDRLDKNGENLNVWMLANGHGVPYDGGTKKAFVASPAANSSGSESS
ncbi:MAG: hypothetical protein WC700_04215 [Gemmatimonadaceae bacterium]|jgi:endonuclease YncB( thermonuclease family)